MIVHLVTDDKFLNHFFIPNLKRFVGLEGHSFLLHYNGNSPLNPVKDPAVQVEYVTTAEIYPALFAIKGTRKVIIHCLTDHMRKAVASIPKGVEVIAIVYGYEWYKYVNNGAWDLYQPKTKAFLTSPVTVKPPSILKPLTWLKYKNWQGLIKKSFNRIDKIAHYLPAEYELFKRNVDFTACLLDFNLGVLDQTLDLVSLGSGFPDAVNILLCNSAALTNNHLDCMHAIDKSSLSPKAKIYCPLSYPDVSKAYIDEVVRVGQDLFGAQFIPLLDFMPAVKYNEILESCGIILMNQYRSQGGASVFSAMYRGSCLYLSRTNPFYSFFENEGAIIFDIENEAIDLGRILTQKEKEQNREVLRFMFSDEKVKSRYINLLS